MRKFLKGKTPALLLLIASISTYASAATAQPDSWGGRMHDGWGYMFFGSFMMLLFWGGLILLVILAVRWMGGGPVRGGDGPPPGNRALDILEERFARGEIDKEEFEERKRTLSK